ncbi:hypothetical protein ABZS66_25665 [Dactylosporangium sp. NPDC005572]
MSSTDQSTATPATATRRPWTAPRVECLETRPEVSAYSGAGDPWFRQSR